MGKSDRSPHGNVTKRKQMPIAHKLSPEGQPLRFAHQNIVQRKQLRYLQRCSMACDNHSGRLSRTPYAGHM